MLNMHLKLFTLIVYYTNSGEDEKWWLLPATLMLFKLIQARLTDWHIANLEVQDFSLYCPDPDAFWAYEPTL